MGQQQILDLLKKYPDKWFSAKKISKESNPQINAIRASLKKLRICKFVNYKKVIQKNRISTRGRTAHMIYVYQYRM